MDYYAGEDGKKDLLNLIEHKTWKFSYLSGEGEKELLDMTELKTPVSFVPNGLSILTPKPQG